MIKINHYCIYDLSGLPEFEKNYTPFFIDVKYFTNRIWSPFKPSHVNHIPESSWFNGTSFKLPFVVYSSGAWQIVDGKYRLSWMIKTQNLKKIPVYLKNTSIAESMIDGIIQGIDRKFCNQLLITI